MPTFLAFKTLLLSGRRMPGMQEAEKLPWLAGQLTINSVPLFARSLANAGVLMRNLQHSDEAALPKQSSNGLASCIRL